MEAYFLSFVGPHYSRSSLLLNFESDFVEKHYIHLSPQWRGMIYELVELRKKLKYNSVIIVMSPAHKIAPLAKLITGKKIYLDAGWPLTDGVLSRGVQSYQILKLITSFLLDFISFHSADIIQVESMAQLDRINRIFAVPRKRLRVSFTGVNEGAFSQSKSETPKIIKLKEYLEENSKALTVLFRGRINNESGIKTIIAASKELQFEANFILVTGPNKVLENLTSNCFLVSNVTDAEMGQIYTLSDVALGQISMHSRLRYTIPHKAFEAGYFGKCYVTPRSMGLMELYSSDSIYFLEEASVDHLVSALRSLMKYELRRRYELGIKEAYGRLASQKMLNENFEKLILLDYEK